MKVVSPISTCYDIQLDNYRKLQEEVEQLIHNRKPKDWHYRGRIKDKESFALKIESGRVSNPMRMEDFFACTLVVKNSSEIKQAINMLNELFRVLYRRPPKEDTTDKESDSFSFDDLRLYLKLRPNPALPADNLRNILSNFIFEIQVKTFLQHAWAIATHDLIYKGDELNWAKERVAYQIKAMLEHAEISINEIEKIKSSDILAKTNQKTQKLVKIKDFLRHNWDAELLPIDIKRLTINIAGLIKMAGLSVEQLQSALENETREGKGKNILNLSPHFIILQTIINQFPERFITMQSHITNRMKLVIPAELDTKQLQIDESKIIRI